MKRALFCKPEIVVYPLGVAAFASLVYLGVQALGQEDSGVQDTLKEQLREHVPGFSRIVNVDDIHGDFTQRTTQTTQVELGDGSDCTITFRLSTGAEGLDILGSDTARITDYGACPYEP